MTTAACPPNNHQQFVVGEWFVDGSTNRLQRGHEVRPLRAKAMALLLLLARRAGETVSRDEIVQAVWDGNVYVAQKGINNAIWTIRQALGDDPDAPRYLETIAKKGYRLIAPVSLPVGAVPPASPAPASPAPALPTPRTAPRALLWAGAAALLFAAGATALLLRPGAPDPAGDAAAAYRNVSALTHYPGHEHLGQISPDGRLLAFGWWQGRGDGELYLRAVPDMAATPQPVSRGAGEITGLAWSPDSQTLAFVALQDVGRCSLWLYSLRSAQRQLLSACQPLFTPTVAWSPDGRWIVFTGQDAGVAGLFLIAPDGSGRRRLTSNPAPAMPDHQPAFSPDSQRIAFMRADTTDGTRDLHEATLDGRVTRLSQDKLLRVHGLTYAANGQDLVFSSTRHDSRMLFVWQRHGARTLPLGLEGSAPARAPGGGLVHVLMRGHVSIGLLPLGDATVATAAAASAMAAPTKLVSSVGSDRQPQWHAAARRLLFTSRRSGHQELWTAGADGSDARPLTRLAGVADSPVWSPDGQHVAFTGPCGEARRHGLCQVHLGSGQVQAVAADGHDYGEPLYSASGRHLWASSNRGGRWQLWRFARDASPGAPDAAPLAWPSAAEPGRTLALSADGRWLHYLPRGTSAALQAVDLAASSTAAAPERALPLQQDPATLVTWRLHPQGVLLLTRGDAERFELVQADGSGRVRRTVLSTQRLGSLPENARFSLAADGRSAWVELSDTGFADLMWAR